MIKEIEIIQMPKWLIKNEFKFNVNNILEYSLYYPSSRFDGDPIKYFMGNIYSFIYVDYGVSKVDFRGKIEYPGFKGYSIIHKQNILQKELTPKGWSVKINPNRKDGNPLSHKSWIKEPFCEWIIFERNKDLDNSHNPKRFSLLYLCADGVAAYQALYLSNNNSPIIIAIIQPGHGFGGNWTNYTDRNMVFANSVLDYSEKIPKYIINGGWGKSDYYTEPIWPEYNKSVYRLHTGKANLIVWRNPEII